MQPRDEQRIEHMGYTVRCCAEAEFLAMAADNHPVYAIFCQLHDVACKGSGKMTEACAFCDQMGVEVEGKVLEGCELFEWAEVRNGDS